MTDWPRRLAFLARHRRRPLVRRAAGACRAFLDGYENLNYDLTQNGESFVLARLADLGAGVFFDVGANAGDWTLAAKKAMPAAHIHAFEIVPHTAATLTERLAGVEGVVVNAVGLAEREGEVQVRRRPGRSVHASMIDAPLLPGEGRLTARTTTGDHYVADHNINKIDLLKIDVEGAEHLVLAGFEKTLAAGAIACVQFEYGKIAVYTRYFLRHFYDFFEERGYMVGKVYPNYVDFRGYAPEHEDFRGPNYLAVRKDRPRMISAFV
jgi:FkbM family methyltransferase